jgi:hypothetical protein
MLPPAPIRRLLLVPLVIVIAATLVVLTPPVALLSAAYNLVRRRTQPDRARQSRLLRVTILGLAWSIGETAALTVSLGLWIASGFGGHLDTEPYRTRNYAVMRWFLDLVYRVACRACGLKVTVTGPADASASVNHPVIVLSRHAGPGDSLLLVHHLLSVYDRRPRVVMKASLQLDPSVDILANRLPNAFLRRAKKGPADAANAPGTNDGSQDAAMRRPVKPHSRYETDAADSQRADQIRRLAAGLDRQGALLLFPEGGNWTPLRWRRGIQRLGLRRQGDLAKRAAAMPNVLPPHPAGVIAAITACPAADVIFVAHAGLDRLVSVRDVWHRLLGDLEVDARWWRVPAAEVPRTAPREAQVTWLYDWWQQLDTWIGAQHQSPPAAVGDSPVSLPVRP